MTHTAIESFRRLPGKSKKILVGLVRASLHELIEFVPVIGTAIRLLEELANHDRVGRIGDFYLFECDAIDTWLAHITNSLRSWEDRLERLVSGTGSWHKVAEGVQKALLERSELAEEFKPVESALRQQTLSLHRVEQELITFFREQRGVYLSLEDIKALLLTAPLLYQWANFRNADPEGLRRLRQADELIRSGQYEKGEQRLFELLRWRGAGEAVIARRYALRKLAEGNLPAVAAIFQRASDGEEAPFDVAGVLAVLSLRRSQSAPAWRGLPRGLNVCDKYRIEDEMSRSSRTSVYRVVGLDPVLRDKVFALKVSVPGLVEDAATADRLMKEIERSRQLSEAALQAAVPPPIVPTFDGVVFYDLTTGKRLVGQVMEFIYGHSLAYLHAFHQASRAPLMPEEIDTLMRSVCAALDFLHGQDPLALPREVTSRDVMRLIEGKVLLLDCPLERGFDGSRPPPEPFSLTEPVERLDVYLAGKFLQELLTLSHLYDAGEWQDLRQAWIDLSADATSPARDKRPRSMGEFLDRLSAKPRRLSPTPLPEDLAPNPRPAAPRTLVVDPLGGGDCLMIGEALKKARPGTRIQVRPGLYREGIRLTVPVELVGEGPRGLVVVENDAGSALVSWAPDAVVRGLTLRCRVGDSGKGFFGVDIPFGRLVLEDCDVTSDSLSCVGVHGSGANPLVRKCSLFDSQSAGLFVYDGAQGTVEGCDVFGNSLAGVAVSTGGNPRVVACKLHDNKAQGIMVWARGLGTFEGCDVFGNTFANLQVSEGGNPRVSNCRFHAGKNAGILVYQDGSGTFEDCDVFANALAGVIVKQGSDPRVLDCRVHDGKTNGILVHEQGYGTFEGCEVFGNAYTGLYVETGADPTVRACRINRNVYYAVAVVRRGRGLIEDCDLTGNQKGAWYVEADAGVNRRNNRE